MFVPKIGGSILSQAPRNLILVIIDGPKKGERVVLRPGEVCVVGRTSAANLACEDQYMSSKHFEVVNRIEDFSIRDLNSRNGTKIKDEAISELALTNPSTVKAGTSTFEVAWENTPEEWGTQIGSSVSMKRSGSLSGNIAAMPIRSSSSVFSTAPGENSQISSYITGEHEVSKAERSQDLVLESLFADQCLRLFHPPGRIPAGVDDFQRLYYRPGASDAASSFFHERLLGNLSFFAIANFAKIGVENPSTLPCYPLFPNLDSQARCTPVAIARKPWIESCQSRWATRLASLDSLIILLSETSVSPEALLQQIHLGAKPFAMNASPEDPLSTGMSSHDPLGIFPWYEPSKLMMLIGSKPERGLRQWIPSDISGILIPHGMSHTTYAIVRPRYAGLLLEAGFQSIPW